MPETPSDHRRVLSSSAALRLKVVTRARSASMEPSRTRRATRRVSTLVFPAPAPAMTQSSGSSASMAARWASVRRLAPGSVSQASPSNVITTCSPYRTVAPWARGSGPFGRVTRQFGWE